MLLQGDEFGTMKTQGAALGARSFCPFYKKIHSELQQRAVDF